MEIELRRFVRAIRRSWWIPLILAVVLAPSAWVIGNMLPSAYVATSLLLVAPESNPDMYRQMVTSGPVLETVIVDLDLDITREDLALMISTRRPGGTNFLEIQVWAEDPDVAAEINHSVTKHVELAVTDLTVGKMRQNLDDLKYQADMLRGNINTFDARISLLEGEDGAESQSELATLRTNRLQVQQTLVDIESHIRSLTTSLASVTAPITIVESAFVPSEPEGTSPVVLAIVVAVLGFGVGAVIGLWREFRDSSVQDSAQVAYLVGTDGAIRVTDPDSVHMVATRAAGIARKLGSSSIVATSPRDSESMQSWISDFLSDSAFDGVETVGVPGMLDATKSISLIPNEAVAILIVEEGTTTTDDVQDTLSILRDFGVATVSPVLIQK